MSASLIERLGIFPIIQAPMAGVATPALAAAVSNAGALGSLGFGTSTPAQARDMMQATRALTQRPFLVNVFCHVPMPRDAAREAAWLQHLAPLFALFGGAPPSTLRETHRSFLGDDETYALLLAEVPAAVSFHFGLPPVERIRALQDAGIVTLATATNVQEAKRIENAGVDAIVAQGVEAGGHRGVFDLDAVDEGLSTAVLVRQLVKTTTLPVIAAGGVMDGQGIRAMLDLGACAAQLGTAFIACPESAADASYRANLQSPRAASTRLTSVFSGRPARGIINALTTHGHAPDAPPPAGHSVAYDATKQLHALASKQGNAEFAAHWAGQGAPLARALPAKDLVKQLMCELEGA